MRFLSTGRSSIYDTVDEMNAIIVVERSRDA